LGELLADELLADELSAGELPLYHYYRFLKLLFFSSARNDNAYQVFGNSTAMYKDLKALRPGGIRTKGCYTFLNTNQDM
jgi:hypothetical protein